LRTRNEGRHAGEASAGTDLSTDGALPLGATHAAGVAYARQLRAGRRVVEGAIAVVVDAVAGLRDRKGLLNTGELTRLAVRDTSGAGALLAGHGTAHAAAGISLVCLTIAVVIQRVAGLGLGSRRDVWIAHHAVGRTGQITAGQTHAADAI